MREIREGDRFELIVEVVSGSNIDREYRVRSSRGWVAYVGAEFLDGGRRMPRAIKAGNDVHLRAAGGVMLTARVEAVIGEWAAIQRPGICRPEIASLSELTPIPGDEK